MCIFSIYHSLRVNGLSPDKPRCSTENTQTYVELVVIIIKLLPLHCRHYSPHVLRAFGTDRHVSPYRLIKCRSNVFLQHVTIITLTFSCLAFTLSTVTMYTNTLRYTRCIYSFYTHTFALYILLETAPVISFLEWYHGLTPPLSKIATRRLLKTTACSFD